MWMSCLRDQFRVKIIRSLVFKLFFKKIVIILLQQLDFILGKFCRLGQNEFNNKRMENCFVTEFCFSNLS